LNCSRRHFHACSYDVGAIETQILHHEYTEKFGLQMKPRKDVQLDATNWQNPKVAKVAFLVSHGVVIEVESVLHICSGGARSFAFYLLNTHSSWK